MTVTESPSSEMEFALLKSEQQAVIFSPSPPSRKDVMRLSQPWPKRRLKVAFHRNDTVEYILTPISRFLGFADLDIDPVIGSYDDSLSFAEEETWADADVHVVWLTYERYQALPADELETWLESRIAALRRSSSAPILLTNAVLKGEGASQREGDVNAALARLAERIGGLRIYPATEVRDALGYDYWDSRLSTLGGTSISNRASMEHARLLGLSWLPAAVRPRLKAIVLDLDNTLYSGVLGEDGLSGVELTPGHRKFQEQLRDLQESGILLAVASRNEPEDVEKLFETRTDFPLNKDLLNVLCVGWYPKSKMIAEIAAELNIGTDAILFIDDNLGELAEVSSMVSGLHVAHAAAPEAMPYILPRYPNLLSWSSTDTDRFRAQDLASRSARQALRESAVDPSSYLKALEIVLTFSMRPRDQLRRLHEIANKTNQFVLALARFSEAEVEKYVTDPEFACVAFSLRDRLAESGNVGAIFAHREGQDLLVDELCVSCRALGRGIETELIANALEGLLRELPAERVVWAFREGPRNRPGLDWLQGFCGQQLDPAAGSVSISAHEIAGRLSSGADIEKIWAVR